MKLREGYKRIAIRCAERGVYGEYFVRTPESMESARKVVGVLFLFYGICSNGNEGIALTEHTREAECFRDVSYDMMLLADMTSRAVDYHDYLQRMWAL